MRRRPRLGTLALGLLALALAATLASRLPAQAESDPVPLVAPEQATASGCTTASLVGSFAYSFTGAVLLGSDGTPQAGGTPVPLVAAGIIRYDGNGGFSGSDVVSSAGTVRPRQYGGTYTLGGDCTGTGVIDLPGGPLHTYFVLFNGGDEMVVIVTDPGFALLGGAHRQ